MSKLPVALQMYSVRDFMDKDLEGTIKKVAEIGYDGVEFAGTYGRTAAELKAICEKYGVKPISAHVPYDEMKKDIEGVIKYYKELGCEYIVIPYLVPEYRPGTDGFAEVIENAKKFGEVAAKNGLTLQYHNHDFEFVKLDGEYALDVLYSTVPAEYLKTQIDTCWANVGGEDPAKYVLKYTGRAPTVHLKDFSGVKGENMYALIGIDDKKDTKASNEQFSLRPCGSGCQNFEAIIDASKKAGAKWLIIEQDNASDGLTSLECAEKSFNYIKGLNK